MSLNNKQKNWSWPQPFPYSNRYIFKLALWKANAIYKKGENNSF